MSGPKAVETEVLLQALRIDCADIAYMFGLVDVTAQEQSWFQNGGAENCQGAGVYIGPTGANSPAADQVQNSGPWTNLEINFGQMSLTTTLGMYVQGGPSIITGVGLPSGCGDPDTCGHAYVLIPKKTH